MKSIPIPFKLDHPRKPAQQVLSKGYATARALRLGGLKPAPVQLIQDSPAIPKEFRRVSRFEATMIGSPLALSIGKESDVCFHRALRKDMCFM